MDTQSAALLIATVWGLTQIVKDALPITPPAWATRIISFAISTAAVFVVAGSSWGHDQVINGKALDSLDTGAKVMVAIALATSANLLHAGIKAVRNVGENETPASSG